MKYLLTLWGDEAAWEDWSPEKLATEMRRWDEIDAEMREAGVLVAGEGLEPTAAATTVVVSAGGPRIVDGPFAETKEQLGGLYLLDCSDLDEALEWARRIPVDPPASIEVRPVIDYEAAAPGLTPDEEAASR
jgi:hypothetical protein